MRAVDHLTHIDNPEDLIYLKSKAFPVNIRLLKSSVPYKALISHCCDLITEAALTTFEDYKKPHGMSGANLAIPFNIIGIVQNRGTATESVQIMINPVIIEKSGTYKALTNCGSIRLKTPIKVKRSIEIMVEFYNIDGVKKVAYRHKENDAGTVQHEIDHNNGILITDRV